MIVTHGGRVKRSALYSERVCGQTQEFANVAGRDYQHSQRTLGKPTACCGVARNARAGRSLAPFAVAWLRENATQLERGGFEQPSARCCKAARVRIPMFFLSRSGM